MHLGRVDTDTDALRERIILNNNSRYNLEDWIIEQAMLNHGEKILDLGCGTGKQLKVITEMFSVDAIGVDVSPGGLDFANDSIPTVCASFDEIPVRGVFTRILATYSIYYAKDMMTTIQAYREMLTPNGFMFLCGAADGTNTEVYSIVNELLDEHPKLREKYGVRWTGDWISSTQLDELLADTTRLLNYVKFESADQVMNWWRHHNSYIPELDEAVKVRLPVEGLELTKNVLGVRVKK